MEDPPRVEVAVAVAACHQGEPLIEKPMLVCAWLLSGSSSPRSRWAASSTCSRMRGGIPATRSGRYVPPLQWLLGTAALPARYLVLLLPYPFIVRGADELRTWVVRRRGARARAQARLLTGAT